MRDPKARDVIVHLPAIDGERVLRAMEKALMHLSDERDRFAKMPISDRIDSPEYRRWKMLRSEFINTDATYRRLRYQIKGF